MKLVKLAPIALLLILSVTAAMAAHTAAVSVNPSSITAGMTEDISLNVKNTGGDGIVTVQLVIPEVDNKPVYSVESITTPQGWMYEYTTRTGQMYPYRITWTTSGSGIASGQNLDFDMMVKAPSQSGNYGLEWLTVDSKGGVKTGTATTRVGTTAAASMKTVAASRIKAGSSLSITVFAYDGSGRLDSDYTGTVSFSSTDSKAILPDEYTFSETDDGYRIFTLKLKTAGRQSVTVKDNMGLSATSLINVEAGTLVRLDLIPSAASVNAGEGIVFSAIASDIYGNQVDVTEDVIWDIDRNAGGVWTDNKYTSENEGVWTVEARYINLKAGAEFEVGEGLPSVGTNVGVEEEIPVEEEVIPPMEETEEVPIEEPETPMSALSIASEDSVTMTPGGNETLMLTISNDGDTTLTGVEVAVEGVPSDWVLVFPLSSDIAAGSSKDYLAIIYVPENETEDQTITFMATSDEGATAEKDVDLSFGSPATGLLEAIPRNILQLGVVIIAVAAVVIIGWELWFKK